MNVAVLPVGARFAERAFGDHGLTEETRKWVAQAVWREKQQVGRDAGIVIDLIDRLDCPWAYQSEQS